jgi:hypothetical protein
MVLEVDDRVGLVNVLREEDLIVTISVGDRPSVEPNALY